MSTNPFQKLFASMSEGPSVLLLGQDFLRQYGGVDYFLNAVQTRFDLEEAESYYDLITNCGDGADLMSIWHNISTRIAVPDGIEKLASLPWNCVLTSAIHEVLDRALAADWRSVTPVLNDNTFPSDPRSRTKLNLYKLFGCVTRDQEAELPPRNELQQLQRNSVAEAMFRQLPSLVTPKGTLFVDSLHKCDWLSVKTLCEAIAQLGTEQAHFFGVTPETESVREIKLLLRLKKVQLYKETLGEALSTISDGEYRSIAIASRTWVEGIQFTFQTGKTHVFTPADWRRLTGGATLLTDADANTKLEFASPTEKYRRFRDFLYGTHGTPNWQAFSSHLAFRRHEYGELASLVRDRLKKQRLNEEPILISGQSGSGKSIALGDLAVSLRSEGWPVVYFGRNTTDIDSGLIERISSDLEKIESTAMLLIWDANLGFDTYASIASYLASRGRKVVVIGSAYENDSRAKCVDFPAVMDTEDAKKFMAHLKSFDPSLVDGISPSEFERRNFWAWLWRLLPESRGKLRIGLLGEIESYDLRLESSLQSQSISRPIAIGTLGAILAEAGFVVEMQDSSSDLDVKDARGKAAKQVERLRGLILIPSSYGQDVPIDLVLRCLGREGFDLLRNALRDTPVYQWIEDQSGNHLIGSRQQLEAQTIVRSSISRSEAFDYVKLLLGNVRARGDWRVFNPEVDFALRLLRAVGPDNEQLSPHADELVGIADVLGRLVQSNGSDVNPWLAFYEGYFRREALLRNEANIDWNDVAEINEKLPIILESFETASEALSRAASSYVQTSDRKQRRAMSRIHNEYAALYGIAQDIQSKVQKKLPNSELYSCVCKVVGDGFKKAVEHCKEATAFDSENYYSLDVRFRVTSKQFGLISSDLTTTDEVKVGLITELCDTLDHESWRLTLEQYNKRRIELAEILDDETIKEDALARLANMGSTAGEYMLAWRRLYYADRTWQNDVSIKEALDRIELIDPLRIDVRLARLYTQGWWRICGKVDLYETERSTVALSREQWEHFGRWLSRRLSFTEEESLQARFLYAWTLFQIGQYRESDEQFRILDRSTMAGRYRVVRLSVWSESDGSPVACQGTIRRVTDDQDKGWVYVPVLRKEVTFRPSDFGSTSMLPNRPLEDFHIAFNYRGAIADPARLFRLPEKE